MFDRELLKIFFLNEFLGPRLISFLVVFRGFIEDFEKLERTFYSDQDLWEGSLGLLGLFEMFS